MVHLLHRLYGVDAPVYVRFVDAVTRRFAVLNIVDYKDHIYFLCIVFLLCY